MQVFHNKTSVAQCLQACCSPAGGALGCTGWTYYAPTSSCTLRGGSGITPIRDDAAVSGWVARPVLLHGGVHSTWPAQWECALHAGALHRGVAVPFHADMRSILMVLCIGISNSKATIHHTKQHALRQSRIAWRDPCSRRAILRVRVSV